MQDVTVEQTPRTKRSWVHRVVTLTVVALLAALSAAAYIRIGWSRMETACTAAPAFAAHGSSVAHSWSWNPPGFTCTYDDGTTETSLWF